MNLNFVKHIDINSDSESMITRSKNQNISLDKFVHSFYFSKFQKLQRNYSKRDRVEKSYVLKMCRVCVDVWWLVKQMFWKERFRDNFDEISDINVTRWQAGQATGDTVHRIVVQEPFYCRLRQSTAEDLSLWRGHCSNLWETLMIVVLSILVIVAVFK